MNVYIICNRYLTPNLDECVTVGGIQTYITNLIRIICRLNAKPIIIQCAEINQEVNYKGVIVVGINTIGQKKKQRNNTLYREFQKRARVNDVLLYSNEELIGSFYYTPSIAIQHGINWDIEDDKYTRSIDNYFKIFVNSIHSVDTFRRLKLVNRVVCVDYNFINWARTQVRKIPFKYNIIPNFSEIPRKNIEKHDNERICILFARRLVYYRGTRLFMCVIKKIIEDGYNISVTIAGDGPDEPIIREYLEDFEGIHYIKYSSDESLNIHRDQCIAVVPTIGSEGTSLSLLEAMASTCAVVATNVGGMTNIIIDGFNGLLINPTENDLYAAIVKLINDNEFRKKIANNAYQTIQEGFSHSIWEQKWEQILEEVLSDET